MHIISLVAYLSMVWSSTLSWQNRQTCVVYGMPRAAMEIGAVMEEISLSAMPEAILAACRAKPLGIV